MATEEKKVKRPPVENKATVFFGKRREERGRCYINAYIQKKEEDTRRKHATGGRDFSSIHR